MGRSSRNETSESTPSSHNQPASGSSYGSESVSVPSRAVTDSESMARDIKEGRLSGFVGHGTTLSGETSFHAMLRVDGHLVGSVSSGSGTLIVGTNGQVDANVMVSSAMVNGVVNGDIIATERVQLGRTAKVVGNIQTPRIIIEEGAVFEGVCSMMKARETAEQQSAEAESQYRAAQTAAIAVDDDDDDDEDDEDDDDELAEAVSS
ncbi:MAG: polymer-forming cytoskeletal protein [Acidobacteria bacterium]|nr:polymer-forming cytoskeletal protein [Acidobacteriota bacterium]